SLPPGSRQVSLPPLSSLCLVRIQPSAEMTVPRATSLPPARTRTVLRPAGATTSRNKRTICGLLVCWADSNSAAPSVRTRAQDQQVRSRFMAGSYWILPSPACLRAGTRERGEWLAFANFEFEGQLL